MKSSFPSALQTPLADIQDRCALVLEVIQKTPHAQGEVFATDSSESRIVFEHTDYLLSSAHANSMTGIRSLDAQQRLGFVTTNARGTPELRTAAQESLALAKLSMPSPFQGFASKTGALTPAFCGSEALLQPEEGLLGRVMDQLLARIRADRRISIDRAEASVGTQLWHIANSHGVRGAAAQTVVSWSVMGMAKTADEVTSFDYDGSLVSDPKLLDNEIAISTQRFCESVLDSLGARTAPRSYRGTVLLHPQAVVDLLLSTVLFHCNGRNQQEGISSWKGRLGEQVTSNAITIEEDPLNTDRVAGWSPFDREGVPCASHILVKEGVLNFVAHNCFSAKRAGGGTLPTGNASGGADSVPDIAFHNLSLRNSGAAPADTARTDAELVAQLGEGLLLKRFSGNKDPASGRFSGVAKNSHWVSGGARSHALKGAMVAGNMLDCLINIRCIGSTLHKTSSGILAPYILVDEVDVTGS